MKIEALKDADITLVKLVEQPKGIITPHCIKHGAMNKFTANGIWRCCSTYLGDGNGGLLKENNCKAGCQEVIKNG